jgi:O-acetyl-ADP-ribose deacetylase (regulator of RNase III)
MYGEVPLMKQIEMDLLDVPKGIICHQINCMGSMGAGIALQIKRKWPIVDIEYMQNYKKGELRLGRLFLTKVTPTLYVANLCGQHNYGRGRRQTDYAALKTCFEKLARWRELHKAFTGEDLAVFVPVGMGCGLGGGDWSTVVKLIEESPLEATFVKRRQL